MVTWRSCMTSRSALCTLAGARLISSASSRLQNTGPSAVVNSPVFWFQMRVPTRSAGTRSGVNWMRRNVPRTVAASVFTVSVFARPGTPSTSRWPPASIETSTRSRKWSWPTTVFFTSYSTRSIRVDAGSMVPLEGGKTDRRSGVLDGHGEADADEYALLGRVEEPRDDANDFAVERHQRAAGVAGIHRGIELDQIGQQPLAFGRDVLALQAGDDAGRSRGPDAEREADRDHGLADAQAVGGAHGRRHEIVGRALRLQHGKVVLGTLADLFGLGLVAVKKTHVNALGARHDVQVGEDGAVFEDHHAGALLHVGLALGHALGALLAVVRHAAHQHHGRTDDVVGIGGGGLRRALLERALQERVDVVLSERPGLRAPQRRARRQKDERAGGKREPAPVSLFGWGCGLGRHHGGNLRPGRRFRSAVDAASHGYRPLLVYQ